MAFPPVFDRAWDETFPPDTQLANLLGLDIRNFKIDIRERLSLISGTFANRPTPDASWGGAGFGMLYFATDTGQIFQWNGAAWLDVSGVGSKPSIGGVLLSPTGALNIVLWRAPFGCTITNVRGYLVGGTSVTLNARKNGALNHLAADLALAVQATWTDGGAVQNATYVAGDKLEMMVTGVVGLPTQVNVQVDFTRP